MQTLVLLQWHGAAHIAFTLPLQTPGRARPEHVSSIPNYEPSPKRTAPTSWVWLQPIQAQATMVIYLGTYSSASEPLPPLKTLSRGSGWTDVGTAVSYHHHHHRMPTRGPVHHLGLGMGASEITPLAPPDGGHWLGRGQGGL